VRPKLGVLDFNPIQYHAPLYQRLTRRGKVDLDVLYLSDRGYRAAIDRGFGVCVTWDIDLLSGYVQNFLNTSDNCLSIPKRIRMLNRWIVSQEAIIIYGYSQPWMIFAMVLCRTRRIPYLLRGDSRLDSHSTGIRGFLRNIIVRLAVSASSACLAIGQLNEDFYHSYGAKRVTFAPYSVDDERFARPPKIGRTELLARWGMHPSKAVIMFCGKLYPGKRPLDIIAATKLLPYEVSTLFVGDGILADRIRATLSPGHGAVTGFVNQSELPSYYHLADILVLPSEAEKWGLVVNEAMAAGALPVVSDRVGAAADLVCGLGEVYPCGDIAALAEALNRALGRIKDPEIRCRVKHHAARYSLDRTAIGFEQATLAVTVHMNVVTR